jgi:hypothetical protein
VTSLKRRCDWGAHRLSPDSVPPPSLLRFLSGGEVFVRVRAGPKASVKNASQAMDTSSPAGTVQLGYKSCPLWR